MTTTAARRWTIDPAHSKIIFKVKHLIISTVTGTFDEFEGKIVSPDEYLEHSSVTFAARVDSINTQNKDRDDHLRSDDFFSAQRFPLI